MNRFSSLIFLSATLLHPVSAFAQTVFVEQNGRLIVEVESVPAVSDWHPTAKFPNFTGGAAFEWTRGGTTGARNADAGALTYHFKINTPGNYEFRWRSRIGEGTNGTEANDSWVRFPTGSNIPEEQSLNGWTKGFMNQVGAWSWRTVTVDFVGESIRQHFTAGEHTLEISGRSKGHVLDRFTLFKYDSVNFNDGTFTNAPQSPHTGDEIEVIAVEPVPEPEPEPEPETQPEPQPETQQESEPQPEQQTNLDTDVDNTAGPTPVVQQTQLWQIPANQQAANECSNGVISLRPVSAVYTDENDIISGGDLLIDAAGQRAFLKFDLSGIPASAASTALTFNVGAEAGQGEIVLSAASHSDWNESDASQLPDISHFIGSFDGTWSAATRYGIPFDPTLIASDTTTLVMEMAQGADGITVVSSGSLEELRLQLAGPGAFCSDYAANLAETETTDSEFKTEADSADEADTDGGGSFALPGLLLLALLTSAFREYFRKRS